MKLSAIARSLGCSMPQGAADVEISRISSPEDTGEGNLTFIASPKYQLSVAHSSAIAVLVKKGNTLPGKICLEVDDPYCAFAKVGQLFEDTSPLFEGPVHPTAFLHPTAHVHETAFIGPFSVIGKGCEIGAQTVIAAHCVIENNVRIGASCRIDSGAIVRRECHIGNRVIIQSNAVVGSEGFGNAKDCDVWVRIPSFGAVIIEEGAESGRAAQSIAGPLIRQSSAKALKSIICVILRIMS